MRDFASGIAFSSTVRVGAATGANSSAWEDDSPGRISGVGVASSKSFELSSVSTPVWIRFQDSEFPFGVDAFPPSFTLEAVPQATRSMRLPSVSVSSAPPRLVEKLIPLDPSSVPSGRSSPAEPPANPMTIDPFAGIIVPAGSRDVLEAVAFPAYWLMDQPETSISPDVGL